MGRKWSKAKPVSAHGYDFKSLAEKEYADKLYLLAKSGRIAGWNYEPQVFKLDVNGHHLATYKPDFIVNHLDGTDEIVEIKGRWMPGSKLKVKLFKALYPRYKFTVVGTPMDKRVRSANPDRRQKA